MKIISENEFYDLDRHDDISNYNQNGKKNYMYIYSLYNFWLCQFLIDKIDLKKYDIMVENDLHHFLPIKDNEKDIYQLLNSNMLKYFYIRNTLHISKLLDKEIKYVLSRINQNNFDYDNDAMNFIEKTYKKIVLENIENDTLEINYGPSFDQYFASSNSLVLGFRYDEFNSTGMTEDEWLDNRVSQYEFIEKLFIEIQNKISNILNISCKIIQYDEYSVKTTEKTSKEKY